MQHIFLLALLLLHPAATSATEWVIDPDASSITFTGTQTGSQFTGYFTDFDANISFDPEKPANATIAATIYLTSVNTSDQQRNTALPKAEWFHLDQFPTATFTSEHVYQTGPGAYEAKGFLKLRDITKEISLPFMFHEKDNAATVTGSTILNRRDYNVGTGPWATGKWVGLDIEVTISIKATRNQQLAKDP